MPEGMCRNFPGTPLFRPQKIIQPGTGSRVSLRVVRSCWEMAMVFGSAYATTIVNIVAQTAIVL